MGKARKKVPLTVQRSDTNSHFKRSSAETARLIRRFHVLNKELAKCQQGKGDPNKEKEILEEMRSMGGIDWYQKASQLGQSKTRGGDSSKWLIKTLKEHCSDSVDKAVKPLRLLDVGAVAPDNYKSYAAWIQCRPIDLNPQHPAIEQQDFLTIDTPEQPFDIVCLSLVVNFAGDPLDRAYYLLELTETPTISKLEWKKKVLPGREGGERNNFSIVLQPRGKKSVS
ncbi:putative methyltransferase-domain-containing protein [Spinellus fusiger]|nr:putative methyltransferase-domain-containing protein [Spinellus fusiger]